MDVTKDYPLFQSYEQEEQEDWCELSFPSPGDFPDPGMEPVSPALTGRFVTVEQPGEPTWMSTAALFITTKNLGANKMPLSK